MATEPFAPPVQTDFIDLDPRTGRPTWKVTKIWENWLRSLVTRAQAAGNIVAQIAAVAQAASIALTPLIASPSAATYRVTYRFRVTQAATTSSSLTFTVTTTDGAIVCTNPSAAYALNLTNQPQTGSFLVRSDAGAPISYSTIYASVGATPMQYSLDVTCEAL